MGVSDKPLIDSFNINLMLLAFLRDWRHGGTMVRVIQARSHAASNLYKEDGRFI